MKALTFSIIDRIRSRVLLVYHAAQTPHKIVLPPLVQTLPPRKKIEGADLIDVACGQSNTIPRDEHAVRTWWESF